MNREQISALVKKMNVDTATGEVDKTLQESIVRLVTD